ncbi:Pentatricopeptide repeat-containing protein [Dendrobium catenatum]|uniref:Pentatricopeptide repeat-containing protein n=1 Tax=Dendrobium catenatum TaxID=906689 RepID=A0A2I0XFB6_9ASPA|nr:Pentatricopeptide repeat-containing protein [Dendrobium catenatum]
MDLDRANETFEAIAEKIGLTLDIHSYNALTCAFGKVKKLAEMKPPGQPTFHSNTAVPSST